MTDALTAAEKLKEAGSRRLDRQRQRKGASKAGTENKRHRKHGTCGRSKGWVRPAASLGGPDPGATRRLCPGRIVRALPVSSSRKSSKT